MQTWWTHRPDDRWTELFQYTPTHSCIYMGAIKTKKRQKQKLVKFEALIWHDIAVVTVRWVIFTFLSQLIRLNSLALKKNNLLYIPIYLLSSDTFAWHRLVFNCKHYVIRGHHPNVDRWQANHNFLVCYRVWGDSLQTEHIHLISIFTQTVQILLT